MSNTIVLTTPALLPVPDTPFGRRRGTLGGSDALHRVTLPDLA